MQKALDATTDAFSHTPWCRPAQVRGKEKGIITTDGWLSASAKLYSTRGDAYHGVAAARAKRSCTTATRSTTTTQHYLHDT